MIKFVDLDAMHREVEVDLDAAYQRVRETSGFIGGPELAAFESEWAAYCGTDFAVGVANGTDAIELALDALDVGVGHEVIVPTNTFVATVEAVVRLGATPRFVDVDPDTLLMTPDAVKSALTSRTKAIIAVHLYGQMADVAGLLDVAAAGGTWLIEDAAQAHGATYDGRRAGSFGHVATFSFYPGKNLGALGDGGAVVTSDAEVATRVRSTADHGRDPDARSSHIHVGRNSRLDGLQAAFLRAKLPRLDGWNDGRRRAMARYRERLEGSAAQLVSVAPQAQSVHHLNVVQVPGRDHVVAALAARGVQSGIHYPTPCHRIRPYQVYHDGALPVAEDAAGRILSLPMSPHLSLDDVDLVCDVVLDALRAVS